jgi:uncharacterized protein YndB with AHSA1/START domain
MDSDHIAKASVTVDAERERVFDALVNPEDIEEYMFGTTVVSDWREGSPIVWKGEWKGKRYEDKGEILELVPNRRLRYTHFSPLSGEEDAPENYHTVTVELAETDSRTRVTLTQDNNPTEEARRHSEENWSMMLDGLKKVVEGPAS